MFRVSRPPHHRVAILISRWEQVVKAVASHFRSPVCSRTILAHAQLITQVHVDRYKRSIYAAVETDPFLLACTTSDPSATRFHACERRFKCVECRTFDKSGKRVWNEGRRVVHVNMVEVKAATWDIQQVAFRDKLGKAACGEGDWPFNIVSWCCGYQGHETDFPGMPDRPSLTIAGVAGARRAIPPSSRLAQLRRTHASRSRLLPTA